MTQAQILKASFSPRPLSHSCSDLSCLLFHIKDLLPWAWAQANTLKATGMEDSSLPFTEWAEVNPFLFSHQRNRDCLAKEKCPQCLCDLLLTYPLSLGGSVVWSLNYLAVTSVVLFNHFILVLSQLFKDQLKTSSCTSVWPTSFLEDASPSQPSKTNTVASPRHFKLTMSTTHIFILWEQSFPLILTCVTGTNTGTQGTNFISNTPSLPTDTHLVTCVISSHTSASQSP